MGWPTDPTLAGRALAVRVKNKHADICIISAYIPPCGAGEAARGITSRLLTWLRRLFVKLPARTLPLLCIDANCSFGLQKSAEFFVESDSSDSLGGCDPSHENGNSEVFQAMLEDFNLLACNTFVNTTPTFYSGVTGRGSRTDYICTSRAAFHSGLIEGVSVLEREGRSLQIVDTVRPVDRRPVSCRLRLHTLSYTGKESEAWNQDLIMQGVLTGVMRQGFFNNLSIACDDSRARWEEALRRASPTDMYEVIVSDLASAASPVYKSASCQPVKSVRVKARDAALNGRREAGNACSKFSTAHISRRKSSTVQGFLGLLVNAWKCQVRLDIASRRIRIATAALRAENAEMWANEIDEAWGKRERAARHTD